LTLRLGSQLLRLAGTVHRLAAFALITMGVLVRRFGTAPSVIRPLIVAEVERAGARLLPMTGFLAGVLGFVVIGQTVALLSRVGAQHLVGSIMVTVVVRELGPLVVTVLVLMRVGTSAVIELATARALGEVEALEALGIDPIHYLVVPRVIGLATAVLALTSYFIIGAVASGYLFAFLQDVPLSPGEYFGQIAEALTWQDFALLGLKSSAFGLVIAVVTCFFGLARPLRLSQVAQATPSALVVSLILCVALDAVFIVVYLVM
jgi:phospholipid/cholesterol/gamma-HCH transport system permease protein